MNELTEIRSRFNDLQWKALEYVELGLTLTQSCKKAGYASPRDAAAHLRKNPIFAAEMERRLHGNRNQMKMTRAKVQEMVLEAFDIAKLTSDANAMVRAASEINKMCGFYEVEKAQIELTKAQTDFANRLNELSDEELVAMSEQASLIDPTLESQQDAEHLDGIIDGDYTQDNESED